MLVDRMKRDEVLEVCTDCERPWAATDVLYYQFREHEACRGKNIMVCKNCRPYDLTGLSRYHAHDEIILPYRIMKSGFEAWCFDQGSFLNRVGCSSPRAHTTILWQSWLGGQKHPSNTTIQSDG